MRKAKRKNKPGAGRPKGPEKRPLSIRLTVSAFSALAAGDKNATKKATEVLESWALTNNRDNPDK